MKSILTAITVILVNTLLAQKISIGPELGVNLIPNETNDLGSNYQLGMHFGAQVKYHFSEKFSLSSGIFLTQKKKNYSFVDTTTTVDPIATSIASSMGGNGENIEADVYKTTTGIANELFIQLPVLANYEFKNINFYGGPYASLLVSAKRKEIYETESTAIDASAFIPKEYSFFSSFLQPSSDPETATINSKDGLALFDVGATVGIGYRVEKLNFNLYYSYGFIDYRKDKGEESIDTHKIIQFSIAYLFPLKGSMGSKKLKPQYDLDVK